MQPFANHPLRRVREWANYEVEREERDTKMFQKWDDEDGRV